jgi:hypothetical protein
MPGATNGIPENILAILLAEIKRIQRQNYAAYGSHKNRHR